MKNSHLIVLGFLCLQIIESCDAPCGDDPNFDRDFFISVDLDFFLSNYNKDSARILFQDGTLVFPGPVDPDGRIFFSRFDRYENQIPLDTAVIEDYYLQVTNGSIDIDTFSLEYLTRKIDDRCYDKEFVYLNLYFNDSLVYENKNGARLIYVTH